MQGNFDGVVRTLTAEEEAAYQAAISIIKPDISQANRLAAVEQAVTDLAIQLMEAQS